MRVSKIERQKKHSHRASIFIDGEFAFGVSDDVLLRYGLHVGAELGEREVEEIARAEQEESAKQRALRFLSIRPRSRKEIRDYLLRREFSEDVAAKTVSKLESLRLLDDAAFARMVCRDLLAKKPAGEKLLRRSLFQKGVPRELIDSIVPEFTGREASLALATEAAERQLHRISRSSRKHDDDALRRKILDHLLRRGFEYDTAMSAVRTILR
ncbi:MAG TPA: RecX family transcriptional regulator [Bacteroidota bacterium]|nr:RecX family transcriptional regulator [Bacteroidota bacterium]